MSIKQKHVYKKQMGIKTNGYKRKMGINQKTRYKNKNTLQKQKHVTKYIHKLQHTLY